METREVFAERIRALIPRGSARRIAGLAGIAEETISRWKNGRSTAARIPTLEDVARAISEDQGITVTAADLIRPDTDSEFDSASSGEGSIRRWLPYRSVADVEIRYRPEGWRPGFQRVVLTEREFGRYSPGDALIVSIGDTNPEPGDLVWASVAGEPAALFRFSIEGGAPCLSKDNPLIPKIKGREWQILGIVEDLVHREKSEL